jgi:hypothetical protein
MIEYSNIDEVLKEFPLPLKEIFEKYGVPIVIFKDNWKANDNMKFIVRKVAKDNEKLRVFGHFVYGEHQRGSLQELKFPDAKFRFELYVEDKYKVAWA